MLALKADVVLQPKLCLVSTNMTYELPDHCRYAFRAAKSLGLTFEDLDDGHGYLFSVSNGKKSLFMGAGRLCAYPLNSAASYLVAKDKGFTNRLLDRRGIANLGGRVFFLTNDHSRQRAPGMEVADALTHLEVLGFPAFCKPLNGSKGDFAEVVNSKDEFVHYAERVSAKYDSILIQRVFVGDEYRLFVLDDAVVYGIEKPLTEIVGDGKRSVAALVDALNEEILGTGVSPFQYSASTLADTATVPGNGIRIGLRGRRNFSSSHRTGDLLDPCPEDLRDCALAASRALNLRVAGVDVMRDSSDGQLRVIEVNASPGIRSLEDLGRWDLIDEIWRHVLLAAFASSDPIR